MKIQKTPTGDFYACKDVYITTFLILVGSLLNILVAVCIIRIITNIISFTQFYN